MRVQYLHRQKSVQTAKTLHGGGRFDFQPWQFIPYIFATKKDGVIRSEAEPDFI